MSDERAAFGRSRDLVLFDKVGRWAAGRKVQRYVGPLGGKRVGDFGCGFDAAFMREHLHEVAHATLVDFQVAADLKELPRVTAIEGTMPEALSKVEDASLDVVICVSVLEHIWDDAALLQECRRVLAPGGVLYVHVPSWHGKRLLEISAFRFGISADEMDDHKRYYNPTDLWRLLRTAGFMPHAITCRYHQLGCSTYAVCRPD